jgi:hypothetical protein
MPSFNNLLTVNTKNMSASAAYDLLSREAANERTTLAQYVALMKQHIAAKDKEITAWERKLTTGAIPFQERAKAMETWEQCKKECFHLSGLSSLYSQQETFLKTTKIGKPTTVKKVIKEKAKTKVEEKAKVVVEPVCEEDEWEMNATNFAI